MVSETYLPPARLLASSRWAALAVVVEGAPSAAMTSYTLAPDGTALYVHLSQMALHTRALLEEPRAALVVSAPDPGDGDPQTLPRLSLSGVALALSCLARRSTRREVGLPRAFPGRRRALRPRRLRPLPLRAGRGPVGRRLRPRPRMSGAQLAEALQA